MSKRFKIALMIVVVLALAVVPAAFAGLSDVGVKPDFRPPVTSNGFPQWYTDANGVTVELPMPPAGDGLTAPTMIYGPLTPASNAVALRAGFDTEAFYFMARSDKNFKTTGGNVIVTMGLEASYGTGTPTDGQQVTFTRIRIKAPVKVAGTYTFSHPWGQETINVTQADVSSKNKGIFFTHDYGLSLGWNPTGLPLTPWIAVAPPGGFYTVLQGANTVSTFLVSTSAPLGWIGDGVNATTVTGSPIGYNKVRLQGPDPNLDGKGNNFIETSLFVVSGHIPASVSVPLPLTVDRATASTLNGVPNIDLFLTSKQGATVTVTQGGTTLLAAAPVTDPSGKFYLTFPGSATPITVTVDPTITTPGFTTTTKTPVPVVEVVNITAADYTVATKTLTVTATSGATPAPTLTVTGLGAMTSLGSGNYTLTSAAMTSPPTLTPSITVTSSAGGADTHTVTILP